MNLHHHIANFVLPTLAFFWVGTSTDFFISGLLWFLLFFVPVVAIGSLVYRGFSGPLRRQERTRMFLDLLEAGFRQGQRPEVALAQAAQTNDPSLDRLFQRLAARLRMGSRLSRALDEVPALLPPQIAATMRVGEELGDVRKVLPACRALLKDADSQTRNGFNYLVIANLVLMPTMPILILILNILIFPRFVEITNIYHQPAPALTSLVMRLGFWVAEGQLVLAFCLWCWVGFYIRGPRAYGWVRVDGTKLVRPPILNWPPWKFTRVGYDWRIELSPILRSPLGNLFGHPLARLRDRIMCALPWRRRRLQRDFCATLSLLLDSETPEPAAMALAAEATANYVFIQRARRALQDLSAGQTLQAALRRFDKAGEFSWRLANAAAQQGGFLPALSGWMAALDAKAFQQEQTASQLLTTGLVLCNGLVVGLIAIGIFAVLISLMQLQ